MGVRALRSIMIQVPLVLLWKRERESRTSSPILLYFLTNLFPSSTCFESGRSVPLKKKKISLPNTEPWQCLSTPLHPFLLWLYSYFHFVPFSSSCLPHLFHSHNLLPPPSAPPGLLPATPGPTFAFSNKGTRSGRSRGLPNHSKPPYQSSAKQSQRCGPRYSGKIEFLCPFGGLAGN